MAASAACRQTRCKIHTTYLGGGFGRRGEADFVTDAVETSKAVGEPVKVDLVARRRHAARLLPAGHLRAHVGRPSTRRASRSRSAAHRAAVADEAHRRRCRRTASTSSRSTARPTLPYDIPNIRVEYTETDPGIPYGFWRSVGASVNGFVVEGVHRRDGDDGRQGSVSSSAATLLSKAAASPGGARAGRPRRRLGQAAAAGPRPRHRRAWSASAASSARSPKCR